MTLDVRPVDGRADLERFLRLPWALRRGDPGWIPPLVSEVRARLDRRHPFFAVGDAQLFLAWRGREVVGRVSASHDARFEAAWGRRAGWFGFFECRPDAEAARALLDAARDWCRSRGAWEVLGPASLNMNDECGLLVEGFEAEPVMLMPSTPPHYVALVEGAGLVPEKDLLVYRRRHDDPIPERFLRLAEAARARGAIRTRGFERRHFQRDVGLLRQVFNAAWAGHWGTVPFTPEEMLFVARQVRPIAEDELIRFALVGEEPVAVVLTVPDYNPVLRRLDGALGLVGLAKALWHRRRVVGLRTILLGVVPEFRGRGLEAVLHVDSERIGRARGYRYVDMGWTLEDNEPVNVIARQLGRLHRRYRIYRGAT